MSTFSQTRENDPQHFLSKLASRIRTILEYIHIQIIFIQELTEEVEHNKGKQGRSLAKYAYIY